MYGNYVYQEERRELNEYGGQQQNGGNHQRDLSPQSTRDRVATQHKSDLVPGSHVRKRVRFLTSSQKGTPRLRFPSGRVLSIQEMADQHSHSKFSEKDPRTEPGGDLAPILVFTLVFIIDEASLQNSTCESGTSNPDPGSGEEGNDSFLPSPQVHGAGLSSAAPDLRGSLGGSSAVGRMEVVIYRPTHVGVGRLIELPEPLRMSRCSNFQGLWPCDSSRGDVISPDEMTVRFTDLAVRLFGLYSPTISQPSPIGEASKDCDGKHSTSIRRSPMSISHSLDNQGLTSPTYICWSHHVSPPSLREPAVYPNNTLSLTKVCVRLSLLLLQAYRVA